MQAIEAPFQQVFAQIAENRRRSALVEDTGWLPHATTPFDRIDVDAQDASEVGALIAGHYVERWEDVAATFRESLARYDIDAEAKATFDEAPRAHGVGLFRAVPRLLFPEIERVASVEFYGGKHEIPRENRKGMVGITSLPGVRRHASQLPSGDVLAYDFGMDLFRKMEAHLYEKVGEEAERIAAVAADPLPNRHAALHGIVSYTTAQNSINMLIMTDFVFSSHQSDEEISRRRDRARGYDRIAQPVRPVRTNAICWTSDWREPSVVTPLGGLSFPRCS